MQIGYNTDNFSEELKNEIIKEWKNHPDTQIRVLGPARSLFVNWLNENYPEAVETKEGYFVII